MLATHDRDFMRDYLQQSEAAVEAFRSDPAQSDLLAAMTAAVVASMRAGGSVLIAGNGGSAGDAQHLAGEFTGRMLYDRPPLPAVALHCDTSALTAIGNDYGFEHIYERQVNALGRSGDVFLGLSTSGNSPNVLRAMDAAKARGLVTLGFTGSGGGAMAGRCDLLLRAPSAFTPVIQQIHMIAGHILCALVERAMFPRAA
jgi:D-sedoheptulose 7-phosphate isomerase